MLEYEEHSKVSLTTTEVNDIVYITGIAQQLANSTFQLIVIQQITCECCSTSYSLTHGQVLEEGSLVTINISTPCTPMP